jgi:hypothetical protein
LGRFIVKLCSIGIICSLSGICLGTIEIVVFGSIFSRFEIVLSVNIIGLSGLIFNGGGLLNIDILLYRSGILTGA